MPKPQITDLMLKRATGATLVAALAGKPKGAARDAGFAAIPLPRLPPESRAVLSAWFDGLHFQAQEGAAGRSLRALHLRRRKARAYAHLDTGSVRDRVLRRLMRRLGSIARAVECEAPGASATVSIGRQWSVDVTHRMGDTYSSRCTWRVRVYACSVEIPVHFARGILSGDLRRQIIGGMPTWHGLPEGNGTSPAWWVESGRGYSLHARTGFVARVEDIVAHGPTAADALAAATKTHRRLHPQQKVAMLDEAERFQRRVVRLKRHWGLMVGFDDSFVAGNCESGTTSWAARFAGGRSEATVREVLELALTCCVEVERAVAACEAAVRRARTTATVPAAIEVQVDGVPEAAVGAA